MRAERDDDGAFKPPESASVREEVPVSPLPVPEARYEHWLHPPELLPFLEVLLVHLDIERPGEWRESELLPDLFPIPFEREVELPLAEPSDDDSSKRQFLAMECGTQRGMERGQSIHRLPGEHDALSSPFYVPVIFELLEFPRCVLLGHRLGCAYVGCGHFHRLEMRPFFQKQYEYVVHPLFLYRSSIINLMDFRGIELIIHPDVYEPAEDSFMLADAAASLRGAVLEVGCGCGIASLACAKADKRNEVLGVDINPSAIMCANENAKRNGIANVRFIKSDLFQTVPKTKYDAIMFNPPYLPTRKEERLSGGINHAYDGGADGRAVLDRFLSGFDAFMKPGATLLLVQSSLNDLGKTDGALASLGYSIAIAAEEKFFFEKLFLLRAVKG
jgi:release factor glutamine methyltransferase